MCQSHFSVSLEELSSRRSRYLRVSLGEQQFFILSHCWRNWLKSQWKRTLFVNCSSGRRSWRLLRPCKVLPHRRSRGRWYEQCHLRPTQQSCQWWAESPSWGDSNSSTRTCTRRHWLLLSSGFVSAARSAFLEHPRTQSRSLWVFAQLKRFS